MQSYIQHLEWELKVACRNGNLQHLGANQFERQAGCQKSYRHALLALSSYSRSLLHALVREEAFYFDYERNGKLVVYRNPDEFEAARRQMDYQVTLGCEQQALNPAACVALERALAPLLHRLSGGIHTPSEDVGDCHKFVVELARVTREKYGATFNHGIRATGLRAAGKRIVAVRTDDGDLEADAFVAALGMGSLTSGLRTSLRPRCARDSSRCSRRCFPGFRTMKYARYVQTDKVTSLGEFIRSSSRCTADIYRLGRRGCLKAGFFDVLVSMLRAAPAGTCL